MTPDVLARFLAKVRENHDTGCWVWTGYLRCGYGNLRVGGRRLLAHRVAYEHWVGPIPQGLTIDHLCRNRACVNPAHMEPVTSRINTLRGQAPSALHAVKTCCPQGHPYDIIDGTARRCRTCRRASWRESTRRYKAKVRTNG